MNQALVSTQDRPVRGTPLASQYDKIEDLNRSIGQLWKKFQEQEAIVSQISSLLDFNISTGRIIALIKAIKGHSSAMPDSAGENGDHDARYVQKTQFNSLFANATGIKKLNLSASAEHTIASGVITIAQSFITIDTESDGATDDLDTISGGSEGDILFAMAENDGRTVILKHGTGNIVTADGNDYSLDSVNKIAILIFNGTNWILSRP